MKWKFKREIFSLFLIAVSIIVSFYFYPGLPQTVPTHFNGDGIANGYSSKMSLMIMGTGLPVALYLLLTFVPYIDPFKKKIMNNYNIFLLFRDLVVGFSVYMLVIIFISAKDGKLNTGLLGIGLGLLFIFLGNYLPKLPRNFFFGIRSPWTLASETVWYRTHRISGSLFVAAGFIIIILTLAKIKLLISIFAVVLPLGIFTAIIYPYFLFRKLEKDGKNYKSNL